MAVAAAGCAGADTGGDPGPAARAHRPVTIDLSVAGGSALRAAYARAAADFHRGHPWITVRVGAAPSPSTLLAAVTGGSTPDAVAASLGGTIAPFCAAGVLTDLTSQLRASGLPSTSFPRSTAGFTGYGGLVCGLPVATRAYGLVVNADALSRAGLSQPPKTWEQLSGDVRRLTVRSADGDISRAGFVPWEGYRGFSIGAVAALFGGHWFDSAGRADLAAQPAWAAALRWQRRLIAALGGPAEVARFVGLPGDALARGRLAIAYGSAAAIPASAPGGRFLVTPPPAGGGMPYGAGQVGGDVLVIPRGAAHPAEAWALIRYLATDRVAQLRLAAALGALPGSRAALLALRRSAPGSRAAIDQVLAAGSAYQPSVTLDGTGYSGLIAAFDRRWEGGQIPTAGLYRALTSLDVSIDQHLALVTQVP